MGVTCNNSKSKPFFINEDLTLTRSASAGIDTITVFINLINAIYLLKIIIIIFYLLLLLLLLLMNNYIIITYLKINIKSIS